MSPTAGLDMQHSMDLCGVAEANQAVFIEETTGFINYEPQVNKI